MKQNPWLGLATYDEQAVAQGYKFCGRERAIKELYSIIDNNLLTTLYGKSGIGKSSLLQAGVFPCLRSDNYLPIMIRLGIETTAEKDYASLIIEATHNAIKKIGGQCVKTREGRSTRDEERLWNFFHTTEFKDRNEEYLFPVIVLDQFEELYYKDKQQLNLLLKSLYLLVDDSSLTTTNDDDSTNYRLVLSIREDDLFHLEDSIDKLRLTEMKYNRYRLNELSDEEARDVILGPASNYIDKEECENIVDTIIEVVKGRDNVINSAILSLICSRIFEFSLKEDVMINSQSVIAFLNSSGNKIISSFLEEIKARVNDEDVWRYLEDELITDEGRRNSVLKSEFDKHVKGFDFIFEGEMGILRNVAISSNYECRIEIIHDLFAQQMLLSRNERRMKEEYKKHRNFQSRNIAFFLLVIMLFISNLWLYTKYTYQKENFIAQLKLNNLNQRYMEMLNIEFKELTMKISYNVGNATLLEDSIYENLLQNIRTYKDNIIKLNIVSVISPEGNSSHNESLAKARADTIAKRLELYVEKHDMSTSVEIISWSAIATLLENQGYIEEANNLKKWSSGSNQSINNKVRSLPIYHDIIVPLLKDVRCIKCVIVLSSTNTKWQNSNPTFGIEDSWRCLTR